VAIHIKPFRAGAAGGDLVFKNVLNDAGFGRLKGASMTLHYILSEKLAPPR